ncbi:MAG: carbohydrate porin [bacterium]|nr:carbohydrate porin [bacterium]
MKPTIVLALLFLTAFLLALPAAAQEGAGDEEPAQEAAAEEQKPAEEKTHKSGYKRKSAFGGPNSPEGQLEEDDQVKEPALRFPAFDRTMGRWFDWKRRVNEEHGFQMSGHYVSLYQGLSDSLGEEDDAASGLFRLNAKWAFAGRKSGNESALVVTVDHRHAFTELAPGGLAGQAGYLGVTGLLLSDIDGAIINLNVQQAFNDRNTGLIIGRYDPSDYQNVLGYANPWSSFQNLAALLDPTVAFPDSSWGIGAGTWFQEQWWVLGTVNDANGLGTDDLELFVGGAELFKQVSFGWSPSKDERYFKSFNASVWHVDEREKLGIDSAEGVGLNANWTWDDTWMAFFRLGFSDGTAPIYNQSATAGFIRYFAYRSDLFGLALNWGDPPDDSLPEQVTAEAFYRLQIAQNLAVTPSVQYLVDPAFNEVDDAVWLFGLRLRMTY